MLWGRGSRVLGTERICDGKGLEEPGRGRRNKACMDCISCVYADDGASRNV